jgi:hypothetical protein
MVLSVNGDWYYLKLQIMEDKFNQSIKKHDFYSRIIAKDFRKLK